MAIVVLDASVVIAFLDAADRHHQAAVAALTRVLSEQLVLPASVYAEILVGPGRRGREAMAAAREFVAIFRDESSRSAPRLPSARRSCGRYTGVSSCRMRS